MKTTAIIPAVETRNSVVPLTPSATLALLPEPAQPLIGRMFANPSMLAKDEKASLVRHLRECVALHPKVSALRVLYGMALCVNLNSNEAIEQLAEAVALAPDSYIAHLKMGELWMRLRVCTKAEDHTRQAAFLAENFAQADLARKQAATIREMLRKGIQCGGYSRSSWFAVNRLRRLWNRNRTEELAVAEIS
jgi:hypothetical protein